MTEPRESNVVVLSPCFIDVDLTDDELATVRANAAALGLSLQDYMRRAILEGFEGFSMKALEFETTMTAAGQIVLPAELAEDIPAGQQLKVVVMWEPGSTDSAWRATGRVRFEEAYSAANTIYEQLIDEALDR